MLTGLKRLLGQRAPSNEQRLADALAALERGWSLDDFATLRDLADAGMADAQYELGRRYERALGVVQNLDDALLWYERAAEQGHAEAQARAGLMLLAGPLESNATADAAIQGALSETATPAQDRLDVQRAARWNRLAAEAGLADAQLRWGLQLAKGVGTAIDLDAAKTWLLRSAEQHDVAGMTAYGVLCAGGYGGERDPNAAVRWLRRAADTGNVDAQYWLGVVTGEPPKVVEPVGDPAPGVADGDVSDRPADAEAAASTASQDHGGAFPPTGALPGVALDQAASAATPSSTSIDWLQDAAEQGHVPAMYRLGLAHWSGQQTPRNLSLAETWLRRAVSRQQVDAMRALGQLQLEQPGNDGIEAASLLWQAAEAGDAPSAALLGELYLEGRGVPRDTVEAARWLVSAGAATRPEALIALAGLPAHGTAVASGQGLGRQWLEEAAERGDIAATFTLGSLHHSGMGVPRDDALAATYFQRAADRGSSAAAFYLGMLHADDSSPLHDDREAIRRLRTATDRHYALAVCNWATLVHQGRGQHADPDQAVRILHRAIARGNLPATTMLADWLTDGRHLPANPQAAHRLLQPALVIGDPVAAAMATRLHVDHGLPIDADRLRSLLTAACNDPRSLARRGPRAIAMARLALAQLLESAPDAREASDERVRDLYEGAAQGGMVQAQLWMLRRLEADARFASDPGVRAEARHWLVAAAARGDVDALLRLTDTASASADGEPVDGVPAAALATTNAPEDTRSVMSARLSGWTVAALSGHALAQRELGRLYLAGNGGPPDATMAARWLQRAADQGDAQAMLLLDAVSSDRPG